MLTVLTSVESDQLITQRSLAKELGIALGLANAYLKRCVKRGYVKVTAAPRRRFVYYLTPKGFAEKTRLTGEHLRYSFSFFRDARTQCSEIFEQCAAKGWPAWVWPAPASSPISRCWAPRSIQLRWRDSSRPGRPQGTSRHAGGRERRRAWCDRCRDRN